MSRRCEVTGKGVMTGNNVSHSNRKTRRRFLPNIQQASFYSDALKKMVSLKVAASTVRTIEHNGGLDQYLLNTSSRKLTDVAAALKKQVQKATAV